jgi:predicted nucleotidyltransferase
MTDLTPSSLLAGPVPDDETMRAAHAFLRRLEGRYPVAEGILFGSRARRAHKASSDADLAVVLKGAHGDRTATALDMAGIAFEVMLDTGVLVEALPLWADELNSPESFSNPALIYSIQREGLRLPARQ